MRNLLIIGMMFLLLCSCGTARKLKEQEMTNRVDSTHIVREETNITEKVIDTTIVEQGKVTITEIDFYPPPSDSQTDTVVNNEIMLYEQGSHVEKMDTTIRKAESSEYNIEVSIDESVTKVKLNNQSVKSIKKTVIEANMEQKGESKESQEQTKIEVSADVKKDENNINIAEKPAPDPYRWRYIFYLAALAAILILILKRKSIFGWIKKILAALKKIITK